MTLRQAQGDNYSEGLSAYRRCQAEQVYPELAEGKPLCQLFQTITHPITQTEED